MQKRKIIPILVTILLLVWIFHKIDLTTTFKTFTTFNFKYIWLIVPLYYLTLYLRGFRWKYLLMNDEKYSPYHLGVVFTVGSMLNSYLPARAGDIYRAYYLGENKNEKKMKLFGSIILERIQDGISVFLILLIGILFYCRNNPTITALAYTIGIIFIGSMIVFYLIFKFNKINKVCNAIINFAQKIKMNWICPVIEGFNKHANSFMEGFEVLDNIPLTIKSFVMSGIIWGIECYVAYLIIASFNLNLPFSSSLFVLSLISFSTMLPSTSVLFGPYQVAYIIALGIYGIDKSTTLAIATIHPILLLVMLTVVGVYYLIKFNFSVKQIKELKAKDEINEQIL